ncbi:MAG: acyltransferase [Burkholderiales bacterium RIFCSPLOWO2_02_FULL_57_36]|nr:MAG: acyltransferase [Burkholderiales bacterium RIFCSPLOWO2_02_FULL_57_36]
MNQSQRLHSLDNLRAVMMWLGIVLHAASNHMTQQSPMPWRDRETSLGADLIILFIHSFRMPVFFIVAGFFVALLVSRRGFAAMLKHRLRRIALPFAIFWPPLFAGTGALVLIYMHIMIRGSVGFDLALISTKLPHQPLINTLHLWFIYYLLWFCVLTTAFGLLSRHIPDAVRSACAGVWKALASNWWGIIVLTVPLATIGAFHEAGMLVPSGSFIPQFDELVHNGLFFVFGWYLHRHQDMLLPLYSRNCWYYAAAGLLPFILCLKFFDAFSANPGGIPYIAAYIAFAYNATSWLWSLALIGLFFRYSSRQNQVLKYFSESSYWAYLVHMLGTIGFGALLYNLPFGALTKMSINIFATTLACLATYHLLVRYTVIGVLLNGQRHSLKITGPSSVVA